MAKKSEAAEAATPARRGPGRPKTINTYTEIVAQLQSRKAALEVTIGEAQVEYKSICNLLEQVKEEI